MGKKRETEHARYSLLPIKCSDSSNEISKELTCRNGDVEEENEWVGGCESDECGVVWCGGV